MNHSWYTHPQRHPKNVDGPFYSLAEDVSDISACHSSCLDCDIPQAEARTLIKSLDGEDGDTYFIKQPLTSDEVSQAIMASEVCCVDAIRYGGDDPSIIKEMNPDLCDYQITKTGEVCLKR